MVGIKGVGGVPDPAPERPSHLRGRKGERPSESAKVQDDVQISDTAQAAASASRLIKTADSESDVRADKVAEAKERLERGDYRNPDVVAQVAERISKFLA